mgnify:CR=1 FL=1
MSAYRSTDIAAGFLRIYAEDSEIASPVSPMKLQKLVYFSQLTAVCTGDGIPIHTDDTKAWDYGPVEPVLYRTIRRFGSNTITLNNPEIAKVFAGAKKVCGREKDIVLEVWGHFKNWGAFALSALTHRKNSPWMITYERNPYGTIPIDLMREKGFGDAP